MHRLQPYIQPIFQGQFPFKKIKIVSKCFQFRNSLVTFLDLTWPKRKDQILCLNYTLEKQQKPKL